MARKIVFALALISFVYMQDAAAKSADLTFNIPHTKLKANVYRTIIHFFEKNGKQYDCQLASYKDFEKGVIAVFSFYKCDTIPQSYKLTIDVSERNVKFHYGILKEKETDVSCINRTYDRWIEIKDAISITMDSLKDAVSTSIPPDVSAGAGFKNIPFGISRDSVNALLETCGYIEGDQQVGLHPGFYENYYEKIITDGKKGFLLIVKLGEYSAKVRFDFTPDDTFYLFRIELPLKTTAYFNNVRDKDCAFLTTVFQKKYGTPDTTYNPAAEAVTPSRSTLVGVWEKEQYTAYTALSMVASRYYAVGVVKSKPLEEAVTKHNKKEYERKLKSASERF
jgi:hypothetical protein